MAKVFKTFKRYFRIGENYQKIIIIILILGSGFYFYQTWQRNLYSKDVVKLEILAPPKAKFGDTVNYIVKVKNQGNIRLDKVQLLFTPPQNSIFKEDFEKEIWIEELNSLYPGEEKSAIIPVKVYGREGEFKRAIAILRYQPKNLTTVYQSRTENFLEIERVPIMLNLDLPNKVSPGKEFSFNISYYSLAEEPFFNLKIFLSFPPNFVISKAVPKEVLEGMWEIPSLNPNEGGSISLIGRLDGRENESFVFEALLVLEINNIDIVAKKVSRAIVLKKNLLLVEQKVNGQENYIARPGDTLHYEITFKNIGEENLTNLSLIVKLNHNLFELTSLKVPNGKFTPGDNTILWDKENLPELAFLERGKEGKVEFWINLKKDIPPTSLFDPNLKTVVIISSEKYTFSVPVETELSLEASGFFEDEVFGNTGPFPPRVGDTTTFTLIFKAKNLFSDTRETKVKIVLPVYAEFLLKVFPEGEKVDFKTKREVEWDIGLLPGKTGYSLYPKTLALQIKVTPPPESKGKVLPLIEKAQISGIDNLTNNLVSSEGNIVDITLGGQFPDAKVE